MQHVRRSDEKDIRQIIIDIKIVVPKGAILLRVKTSSSAALGSPRKSRPSLSTSSSKITGLIVPATLHQLNDLAWQGTNVSTTMTADLRSSCTPPRASRTNLRPVAFAIDLPSDVFTNSRGSDKAQ
jgi:hypothetical protein